MMWFQDSDTAVTVT